MKSAIDPNIYVVGDACIAGDMPKSAFSANSQAKVAAMMMRGELAAAQTFPARYANTCWSLIETDDCVKVGGRYEAKDGKIAQPSNVRLQDRRSADLRKQTQAGEHGLVLRHHGGHVRLSPTLPQTKRYDELDRRPAHAQPRMLGGMRVPARKCRHRCHSGSDVCDQTADARDRPETCSSNARGLPKGGIPGCGCRDRPFRHHAGAPTRSLCGSTHGHGCRRQGLDGGVVPTGHVVHCARYR